MDGALASSGNKKETEPISKEEALKRFLARKAARPAASDARVASDGGSPAAKRKDDQDDQHLDQENNDESKRRDNKKMRQEYREQRPTKQSDDESSHDDRHSAQKSHSGEASSYPASKKSRLDLVPGHQNTTTKEPMLRPPDMRLVTAMASKGKNLTETLTAMNMGPSGRDCMLQTLTTRDVVMIPDLFEASSGFVMPRDPWEKRDGSSKTIYQRLVEEIHHAGNHEARGGSNGGKFVDKCFSTDKDGTFKDDANGLFKAWHKTTPQAAGDGLAAGNDGNGHLIVNDRDNRWRQAQQRGEAPMYTAVHPLPLPPCIVAPRHRCRTPHAALPHALSPSCCAVMCRASWAGPRAHRRVL